MIRVRERRTVPKQKVCLGAWWDSMTWGNFAKDSPSPFRLISRAKATAKLLPEPEVTLSLALPQWRQELVKKWMSLKLGPELGRESKLPESSPGFWSLLCKFPFCHQGLRLYPHPTWLPWWHLNFLGLHLHCLLDHQLLSPLSWSIMEYPQNDYQPTMRTTIWPLIYNK